MVVDLADKETIKSLLRKRRVVPKKKWGQHFLVDRMVLEEIINAAELKKTDTVLEVGPGLGTLTLELARHAKRVIGVEKDHTLVAVLNDILAQEKITNVEVIEGDILKTINDQLSIINYVTKVVADIPYYLTARLLRLLLEGHMPYAIGHKQNGGIRLTAYGLRPALIVLLVQREVAERICASPPHMSLLAVSVQYFAEPEIVAYVPKSAFWPQPAVNSAILRLRLSTQINTDKNTEQHRLFFKVVRAGFSQPRKLLFNNLRTKLMLEPSALEQIFRDLKITKTARAQELSLNAWQKLAQAYSKIVSA